MKRTEEDKDMLPEYDFSDAVQGKYWDRFQEGTNLVLLEPDIQRAFPDSKSVNDALRGLLEIAKRSTSRSA